MEPIKVLAITQARTGSSRLPNKVLKEIDGRSLLAIHLDRILKSKRIDQLIVATTVAPADDVIADIAAKIHLPFFKGSINNVLDRFYQAANVYKPSLVVRLTSDCPLIDASLIDRIIDKAIETDVDYCSNTLKPTFPDGMDIEVFKFTALEKAWKEATLDSEKEHVTPYIHKNSTFHDKKLFTSYNFENETNYENVRLTVDEQSDFEVISRLIERLGIDKDWKAYADYYLSNNNVKEINTHIERNAGYRTNLPNN